MTDEAATITVKPKITRLQYEGQNVGIKLTFPSGYSVECYLSDFLLFFCKPVRDTSGTNVALSNQNSLHGHFIISPVEACTSPIMQGAGGKPTAFFANTMHEIIEKIFVTFIDNEAAEGVVSATGQDTVGVLKDYAKTLQKNKKCIEGGFPKTASMFVEVIANAMEGNIKTQRGYREVGLAICRRITKDYPGDQKEIFRFVDQHEKDFLGAGMADTLCDLKHIHNSIPKAYLNRASSHINGKPDIQDALLLGHISQFRGGPGG